MKDIIFNGHDVALMLVIGLSFILSVRIALSTMFNTTSRMLLVTFFSLNALNSIDTLLFWGDSLKHVSFHLSPWLPLSFSAASFAMGPVFYWFFRSLAYPERRSNLWDYLQLLPVLATPVFLYVICFRYDFEQQRELILNHAIFSSAHGSFLVFLTLKKLLPLIYALISVTLITRNHIPQVKKITGSIHLRYLYLGFGLIWFYVLLTHTLGQWLPVDVSDRMGIFGNYMNLTLLIAFLFSHLGGTASATQSNTSQSNTSQSSPRQTASASCQQESKEVSLTVLAQLERAMTSEKLFLNSQLTLERLAEHLNVSPRQVSYAINHHAAQNFHEYINRFRIEEAKRLLLTPECCDLTVLEIAYQAGFNSKATFNRIFKSMTGSSPSVYRQQLGNSLPPQNAGC